MSPDPSVREARNWCFLWFHAWARWADYGHGTVTYPSCGATKDVTFQRRTCKRCGLTEQRHT